MQTEVICLSYLYIQTILLMFFCRIKQIGIRNVRTQQKQNGEPTQNITGDSITD